MARDPVLLDRWGKPVRKRELKREIAAPTVTGIRSPISGTPADGLDPLRLATILREADQGDPVRYLELAEIIEERDPHYLAVLATRRRAVAQIEIRVEAASDEAGDVEIAERIRDWLGRDELADEVFDILDCIGKGYSFTEIIWDTSEGQWQPARLEWRDPRWFRFASHDLATPMQLADDGTHAPLTPFKFIFARIGAKSGLPLRSGLARVAAWGWMFKAFTQRDWAIFTQTYGQPLRIGKWAPGASEEDKDTLFRAVANIAGDCAGIIPDTMSIEFVEAKNVGSAHRLYKERADWLDQQISKAVLGQTATTDAVTGGLGSGREHREVQEDIERADARALAAILNRDLIRPWVDLEWGPRASYPRLVIARPEPEDIAGLTAALGTLVPLGFRVSASEVRDKLGLTKPGAGGEILGEIPANPAPNPPAPALGAEAPEQTSKIKRVSGEFKRYFGFPGGVAHQAAQTHSAGRSARDDETPDPADLLTERLAREAHAPMQAMLEQIETILAAASDLDEAHQMLRAAFGDIDHAPLADLLAQAMMAAEAGGRAELEEERG